MPSDSLERSREVLDVVEQYLRRERPLSALVVVLAVSAFVGTYLVTSLLPAAVVGVGLAVVARAPVLRSEGTVRLRTDEDPEAVVDEFTGATPPVLALQWGVADEVTTDDGVATYSVSYLFGLQSADVVVHTRTDTAPNGDRLVESEVSINDRPWATYRSTVSDTDGHTVVEVEYTSNRRFGLRRVPQQRVAHRYRDDALEAQGYSVVERDTHFGL